MSDQSRGFKWKHVISSCFFAVWVSTQFKEVEILIHVALRALSVFNNWLPEYFSATSISRNSRTTVVLLSRHIWRRFWLGIWLGTTPSASLRNKASLKGIINQNDQWSLNLIVCIITSFGTSSPSSPSWKKDRRHLISKKILRQPYLFLDNFRGFFVNKFAQIWWAFLTVLSNNTQTTEGRTHHNKPTKKHIANTKTNCIKFHEAPWPLDFRLDPHLCALSLSFFEVVLLHLTP